MIISEIHIGIPILQVLYAASSDITQAITTLDIIANHITPFIILFNFE